MSSAQQIEGLDANYSYYQLWMDYKDAGPSAMLIFTATLLNLIVVPGILMNLAIIFVTLKYRSLRGTSSFLLALTAVYEMVHECGHLYFLWVSASGRNFVPYLTVFKFLAIPLLGCSASLASIAFTGLDRLLQLAFNKWHDSVNRLLYLGSFTLLSFLCGLAMALKYAQVALQHPDWPQTGTISDIFLFDFKPLFFSYMLLVNFLSILFYVAVWLVVKRERASNAVSSHDTRTNQRLFKSLVVIISISIGSYLCTALVRLFLLPPFHLGQVQVWFVELYFGILLNLGVALNAPVLYICSNEYRKCFARELMVLSKYAGAIQHTIPSVIFSATGARGVNATENRAQSEAKQTKMDTAEEHRQDQKTDQNQNVGKEQDQKNQNSEMKQDQIQQGIGMEQDQIQQGPQQTNRPVVQLPKPTPLQGLRNNRVAPEVQNE